MARDRLRGLLAHRQDDELLDLLATVHHQMLDLPAAGALWFVTGRDDELARASTAAWRARYGNDEARWTSIPAPVRRQVSGRHLAELERAAARTRTGLGTGPGARGGQLLEREPWWVPVVFGGGAVLFLLAVLVVIGAGLWTVAGWVWP
jgi:hypothetical protein